MVSLKLELLSDSPEKLHHLQHAAAAGDDAKRIVRRLGGVDFRDVAAAMARDEVFQKLLDGGRGDETCWGALHDGVEIRVWSSAT